jgi:SAM-dependent methyltransferase
MEEFYDEKLLNKYVEAQLTSVEKEIIIDKHSVSKQDKVLDVGCGSGRVSIYLSRFVNYIIGVDISKSAVEYCNKRTSQMKVTNVRCFVADITSENTLNLLKDYSPFNVALLLFNTIEGLPKRDNRVLALKNINRLLGAQGRLILSIHNRYWFNWLKTTSLLNLRRLRLRLKSDKDLSLVDQCIKTSEFNSIILTTSNAIYPWYIHSFVNIRKELKLAGFLIERVFVTEDDNPLRPVQYKILDEINYSKTAEALLLMIKILSSPKYYIIARKQS